jgi:hypothetical protein
MICLFAGPTISAEDVSSAADCVLLPPVSLGDVYRLVPQKPRAIGIIDGYFERTPAVSHKEILWALTQGIHVYGAASMGALRAAELAAFGMVGVGKIFAAYRDGVLEDDDEVAVAHGAAADGYRAASEPMVNIRASVEKALRQELLDQAEADLLLRSAKSLYYPLRTYPAALEAALKAGLDPSTADRLRHWFPQGRVDQKREDALALVRLLSEHKTRRRSPLKVTFPFHRTQMWDYAMRECDLS